MKRLIAMVGIGILCGVFTLSFSFAASQTQMGAGSNEMAWTKNASDILGKTIVSPDGEELGQVEDFVIGEDGQIDYVILSSGGFLGIGDKEYMVRWDSIRPGENENSLVAEIDKSQLDEYTRQKQEHMSKTGMMPAQENEKTGTMAKAGDSEKMAAGQQNQMKKSQTDANQGQTGMDQDKTAMQSTAESGQGNGVSAQAPAAVKESKAKDWIDKTVVGKNGQELGTVQNLFISSDGHVLYAVIASKDNNKLHPVPIDMIHKDGNDLKAAFSEDKFTNSASFAKNEAPNLGQSEWQQKIRTYYGKEKTDKNE